MGKVVVVGSLNMDLVVQTPRLPLKGETLKGSGFGMFVGGKGNNQAIAAARAGAEVSMVGRVGMDLFGDQLVAKLQQNKVNSDFVYRDAGAATGIASIQVTTAGDNAIVLAPGANGKLSVEDVEKAVFEISTARVLLLQLEVEIACVLAAARIARKAGVPIILNPAPAPQGTSLPLSLLKEVDFLIPNQTESQFLTGRKVTGPEEAEQAAKALTELGPRNIIITLGEMGAVMLEGQNPPRHISAFSIRPVDTTAAGDAFCGALAAALSEGSELTEAVRFASAAGALAATRLGAEPSLPYAREIMDMLKSG